MKKVSVVLMVVLLFSVAANAELMLRLDGSDFDGTTWTDTSGKGNDATVWLGAPALVAGVSPYGDGDAVRFDGDDGLELKTINPSTGATTLVSPLSGATGRDRCNALEFQPSSGILFCSIRTGSNVAAGSSLGTIDLTTNALSFIGPTVERLDAIAFAEITGGSIPPSTPATIIVCDAKGELELDAGESAIATCTSVKIEILTGQVLIQFNTGGIPGTSTLGPTNILVYDDKAFTITNLSATDAVMKFNFRTITIPPGETVSIRHLAFPPNGSSHEPPTIGVSRSGNLIVTCGVAFDAKCFTITAPFHEEFKLYEMMSGTHTISITMYCAQGVNTCNYAAIGIMPYSGSMDNTTWKIEVYKDFEGNLTTEITDPEGFLGTVTVTTQTIDDKFWVVSYTVDFKNKDTGPMMFGVQARDSYNSVWNWYLNEGVEFKDSDAYPSILTEFENSLEIDSLCLNEDPTYRYSCAFDKVQDLATKNAESLLEDILNGNYIYDKYVRDKYQYK